MQSKKKKWLALAVAALWTASTVPALAAEEEPAAAASDEHTLEDTVVTATRREKRDLDVPAATMVITGETIKESGASDASDGCARQGQWLYL